MNSPPRSDRNGPGESKAANIGISLPGTGEAPRCPVYIDGKKDVTLEGTYDELAAAFKKLLDTYVSTKYPRKTADVVTRSAQPARVFSFRTVDGELNCCLNFLTC